MGVPSMYVPDCIRLQATQHGKRAERICGARHVWGSTKHAWEYQACMVVPSMYGAYQACMQFPDGKDGWLVQVNQVGTKSAGWTGGWVGGLVGTVGSVGWAVGRSGGWLGGWVVGWLVGWVVGGLTPKMVPKSTNGSKVE